MTATPSRRDVLLAAAALPLVAAARAAQPPRSEWIDVHTHFYDPERPEGVPWPGKGDKVLYRRVLPAEFAKLAGAHGVTGTVVVEASPRVEDNQWLLDQAKSNPVLRAVVGRLSLGHEDFDTNLKRFAKNPLYRGIRVSHADVKTALAEKPVRDQLGAFSDLGLTLDVNGGPDVLADVAKLAVSLPRLTIVVNHLGNVLIDGKPPPQTWQRDLNAAAEKPNVSCKLSALVDGTRKRDGQAPTDPAFYRPVFDAAWNAFGADRLLFGSNWPVSDHYAPYKVVFEIAMQLVKAQNADAVAKVFAATATAVYKIPAR